MLHNFEGLVKLKDPKRVYVCALTPIIIHALTKHSLLIIFSFTMLLTISTLLACSEFVTFSSLP